MEEQKQHGGKRAGAGRKRTKEGAKRYGFIIEPSLQNEFEDVDNKSALINKLLKEYFKEQKNKNGENLLSI